MLLVETKYIRTTWAVMAKTHTHFLISENPFFDLYQIFHFAFTPPEKAVLRRKFAMISVVLYLMGV